MISRTIFKQKTSRGFTLIESVLYIGLASMILTAVSYLLMTILFAQQSSYAAEEVSYVRRLVSQQLGRDARAAQDFSLLPETLILTLPDATSITYRLESDLRLTRQATGGPIHHLTTNDVAVSGKFFDQSAGVRNRNIGFEVTYVFRNPGQVPDLDATEEDYLTIELRGRR